MTRPHAGVSALAVSWRTFRLGLRTVCPPSQSEEQEAVPARAGDLAGDGAERPVLPALVLEAVVQHLDQVRVPLKVPGQQRPGNGQAAIAAATDRPDGGSRGPPPGLFLCSE